jgi:hypothetical protein
MGSLNPLRPQLRRNCDYAQWQVGSDATMTMTEQNKELCYQRNAHGCHAMTVRKFGERRIQPAAINPLVLYTDSFIKISKKSAVSHMRSD